MSVPTPVLWIGSQPTFDNPPKGFWITAPVVVRRILVETPPGISDSDPFARAVVNLAAAGVQRVGDIAELIGIDDLGFVNEVIRRLVDQDVVKLRDGIVSLGDHGNQVVGAVGEKHSWYAIQDGYSGTLWPRATAGVIYPNFDDDRHHVELGTPGRPARRNFWHLPDHYEVNDPNAATVTQAFMRHLADLRIVGIKSNKLATKHLAFLGRPEQQPVFSARLAPGREEARLLIRLDANEDQISAADPFEVGPWFELAQWTNQVLEKSPELHERVVAWAARRQSRQHQPPDGDRVTSPDQGTSAQPDTTLSSPKPPQTKTDRNMRLLSLADRLLNDIHRAEQKSLGLSYNSHHDAAFLKRRWTLLGFRVPLKFIKPVPALVKRAAEGFPSDLNSLFYAWTLLVNLDDGQALALQAPELPALLYANAAEREQTVVPDIRPTTAPRRGFPSESRN